MLTLSAVAVVITFDASDNLWKYFQHFSADLKNSKNLNEKIARKIRQKWKIYWPWHVKHATLSSDPSLLFSPIRFKHLAQHSCTHFSSSSFLLSCTKKSSICINFFFLFTWARSTFLCKSKKRKLLRSLSSNLLSSLKQIYWNT